MIRTRDNNATTFAKWNHFLNYKRLAEDLATPGRVKSSRHEWQPLRCATREGMILGAWTWRTRRDHSEVGLFVCEDHQLYKRGSALNWSLRCIFTQAFYQVGSMEVRFVGKAEGEATLESGFEPVIPDRIRGLAESWGISLSHRNRILDHEARELYFRLTGFDEELIAEFRKRGLDPVRACVLVQRDIWSEEQVRFIFRHAISPERIFTGGAAPLSRLQYLRDLAVLRVTLMAERLRTILEKFSGHEEGCTVTLHWSNPTIARLTSDRDLELSILAGNTLPVEAKEARLVLLLPRNSTEYRYFESLDARAASEAELVCVARDYRSALLPPTVAGRHIIPLFDTLDDIDREIEIRLAQTVGTRSELPEQHE